MKRVLVLIISLLLMSYINIQCKELVTGTNLSAEDSVRIFSTPDLYNLAVKWAAEYNRLYPGKRISIKKVADTGISEKYLEEGTLGFVSKEYFQGSINESAWKVVVGRDVIVPLINEKNPFSDEINQHGVSPDAFLQFFENPDSMKWGTLMRSKQNMPVNYYWINDESVISSINSFLKTKIIRFYGIEVRNEEEMISAIRKDPEALGFSKMVNILDIENQNIIENIRLLPIDRNGNGLIDYNEKIYDDLNVLSRGVWIGKYPKALISNIYSVSAYKPKNETVVAFLKWVITDGQQFLYNNGYSDLLISERQATIDKLYSTNIYSGADEVKYSLAKTILLIIAAIIVTGLLVSATIKYHGRKKASEQISGSLASAVLDENRLLVPKGLYFDKAHTWAFMEQNGIVKVGVNDFLQHITGPLTKVKMKKRGEFVKRGEQILSIIQNGKQLNLYAPVSGTITGQNINLDTNSSVINSSPYNEGWIYLIEPTNWNRESQLLFRAEKYKEWVKDEFSRFKDFLAVKLKADTEKYSQVILQDGGEIRDGILSNLGPEVWEDFQINFIDPSRQVWFYEIV